MNSLERYRKATSFRFSFLEYFIAKFLFGVIMLIISHLSMPFYKREVYRGMKMDVYWFGGEFRDWQVVKKI